MNKGINDLIRLIERETAKPDSKKRRDNQEQRNRRRGEDTQFSFKPKINKKSQRISNKISERSEIENEGIKNLIKYFRK